LSWWILAVVIAALALALAAHRRGLAEQRANLDEIARAKQRGSDKARLQYPHVDLSRCMGCGACVEACPEDGVLALVHGQALVAHGARCVGHGRCATACPVGAIALTLGDVSQRTDIPVLTDALEADGQEGVFLAGEVTGYALVRTAIAHGTAVADEVARRAVHARNGELDLAIVGAGPAGLACALQAKARGLSFVVLEQEELGGTVAKYPRRKLVMTQPVDLPLHGRLRRTSYTKEELIELWRDIAREHELPIRTGQTFAGLSRRGDGVYELRTASDSFAAHHVCLALGRRGTPNKLGVPGEELAKVAYSLLDAQSYTGRRILVVGGGDSAIEAALGLAEQPGNEVTLSDRREAFSRIKARNEARLMEALATGALTALMPSEVVAIDESAVELRVGQGESARTLALPNDEVFVFAGGTLPFQLLQQSGVSFDPARRAATAPLADQGSGLSRALAVALVLALAVLAWAVWFRAYYSTPPAARADSTLHGWLRPAGSVGLAFGVAAAALVLCNLAYLVRRSPWLRVEWGALRTWMTVHVATGIGALLLAIAHSAFQPRATVGGHALAGLAVLVLTGAIGRYLYAFVPHATNGRELALEEVRAKLAAITSRWERENRDFGERVRCEVQRLVHAGQWQASFVRRWRALIASQRDLRATLQRLRRDGLREGVAADQLSEMLVLARQAHRTALAAAHYEDLRALLATWRYVHRWVALLMVLLVALHVVVALRFASLGGGP
jgi:thioredoxin reductase